VRREEGRNIKPCVLQLLPDLGAGGTQRLAIEIVKRLSSEFRMVVCCLDDVGEWAGELTEYDVPVVPLHRPTGFHPSIGARIARLAAEHKATVLHSHHYSPFVYGRIAAANALSDVTDGRRPIFADAEAQDRKHGSAGFDRCSPCRRR
jgi:hypothetical protein